MGTDALRTSPARDSSVQAAYARHARSLIQFATVLVGATDAADVVSEAVVACICSSAWSTVEDHGAYLHRAVLNSARQWSRSGQRRRAREAAFGRSTSTSTPGGPSTEHGGVWDAVRDLSIRRRAVVYLAYWEDLPPARIASTLGISDGAVRRHLARARAHLKEALSDG
jgi:RNA polymerase sigma factor (sigma-70 family)